ncbi:hypothetical protein BGX26_008178 [Mortierella sp. AD094]|nr:hypothetical protein BGX26_008178 [Mortierella sp. AD094]
MDQDDLFAQQWQNSVPAVVEPINQEPLTECDDYWFVNEKKQKEKKVKGWAKPERELTAVEKRKKEREEERRLEREKYLGKPNEACKYNHFIRLPSELPVFRLLGTSFHMLDPTRNEFQCYIWMEQPLLLIAGDDEDKTYSAMNRVKNFILKRIMASTSIQIKQFNGTICHILEKPSKLVEIRIHEFPQAPYVMLPTQLIPFRPEKVVCGPERFLVATELATFENLRELDLRMATIGESPVADQQSGDNNGTGAEDATTSENATTGENDRYFQSMKYSDSMMERNIAKIRKTFEEALEHVQLLDGDIKMRIRVLAASFGQVALMNYPEQVTWDIKELDSRIIPDGRLSSDFSPFFTNSSDKFSALIKKLTPPNQKEPLDAPEMLWTLGILRRDEKTNTSIDAQLEITFRDDDKVAFWNALVQKTVPLDIRVISSERSFSWAWNISAGKRMDADKFSPEGKFVHELHLEKRNELDARIVYSTTNDVQLRHIKREKKWLFARDPWTIELAEESYWTFDKPSKPFQKLTLGEPDDILYSVSMYRDSWVSRFCENPHLGLGQLPSWEPSDFFEGEESIHKTLETISEVRSIIEGLF